jgi:hypothetical protein
LPSDSTRPPPPDSAEYWSHLSYTGLGRLLGTPPPAPPRERGGVSHLATGGSARPDGLRPHGVVWAIRLALAEQSRAS